MTGIDDRDPLVSLSDVAELTGMSRSAVSNWRRRFPDFPEAEAGTAANPQFRFSAIRAWLADHPGLGGRTPTPSDIAVVHLWTALNPYRNRITAELGVEALLSLITWHHLRRRAVKPVNDAPLLVPVPTDGRTLTDIWARAIAEYEQAHPEHARLFRPLTDIDTDVLADLMPAARSLALVTDDAPLFDDILDRYRRASGRGRGEWSSSPELATLLTDLAGPIHGLVYDAAAGVAEILVRAAAAAEDPVAVIGQEIDETAWRIATQRLIVHDLNGHIARGDTLRDDQFVGLEANTVMIDAPIGMKWSADALFTDPRWVYGPPSGFADLAWVQHAIARLPRHGGGRGFVVLADGACFRRGNDARIRAELVRSGSIEAILALPASLTPGTSIRRSVWVVNRPEDRRDPSRILFADPGAGAGGAESSDELGALVDVYRRWRRRTSDGDLGVAWARTVSVLEVLGPEVDLTPARWITPSPLDEPAPNVVEQLRAVVGEANAALEKVATLHRVGPDVLQPRFERAQRLTIGQLLEDGLITIRRGRGKGKRVGSVGDELPFGDELPAVTAASFGRDGKLTTTPGPVAPDELAQPGDVLIVTDMQIRAVVARRALVPIAPVQVISITRQGAWINPRYLAACLNSSWNRRFLTGSGIKHARLVQLEVAVATAEEQEAVIAFLRQTDHAKTAAARLSDAITRLREDTMQALLAGTVTVQPDDGTTFAEPDDDQETIWFEDAPDHGRPGGSR